MKKIILFLTFGLGLLIFYCGKDDPKPDPNPGPQPNTFIDARDGQSYCWIELKDGKKWMAENLNYESTDALCYENKESNCRDYGRLYTWEAAKTACPEGWRLPSDEEWSAMIEEYGEISETGSDACKALIDGGSSGFDIKEAGARNSGSLGNFYGLDTYGYYWSSTASGTDFAWIYIFRNTVFTLKRSNVAKYNYYSCRCVQD